MPIEIPDLKDARAVSSGGDEACAIVGDGDVWCWTVPSREDPNPAMPERISGLDDAVEIGVGTGYACARRETGAVECWGDNRYGQLGRATAADFDPVPAPLEFP